MPLIKSNEVYSKFVGDNNDCAVRALSTATGISYAECSEMFQLAGRRKDCGTPWSYAVNVHEGIGLVKIKTYRETINQFVAAHPAGAFVVYIHGHAIAVVDGIIHDWQHTTGPRHQVWGAWAVPTSMYKPVTDADL